MIKLSKIKNKAKKLVRNRVDMILEEISQDDEVLSMGCVRHSVSKEDIENDNFLLRRIRDKSSSVVGVDILKEEVEKLRKIGFNVFVGDAHNIEIDKRFDKVVAGEIIEHLENPGIFLENCKNHMKKGGKIIVSTPNPRRLNMIGWHIFGRKKPGNPEHTMWFDWYVIDELSSRVGLKVDKVKEYAPGMNIFSLMLYNIGMVRNVSSGGWVFVLSEKE